MGFIARRPQLKWRFLSSFSQVSGIYRMDERRRRYQRPAG